MTHVPEKPSLSLIHGWGLGPDAWTPCLPDLSGHFSVTAVALPGYGPITGDRHGTARSFQDSARELAETLPEQSIICGWSLGAQVAIQSVLFAPTRFKALVLVGGTPRFTQQVDRSDGRTAWRHAQPPDMLDTFYAALADNPATTLQRFVALFNQGDSQARPIARQLNRQLQSAPLTDRKTLLAGLDWLREVDLRADIPRIAIPVLLIHGAHDPLMPLAAARWLASELPSARIECVSDAAHAPFLHDPAGFAKLISDFYHALATD